MKNRKVLYGIIGFAVVLFATAIPDTGLSQPMYEAWDDVAPVARGRYVAPVARESHYALEYKDGFPGPQFYKRQQVKQLQCMLGSLGYCSGPIDGWYGHSTANAVRCYLNGIGQKPGYGHTISWRQLQELESRAGAQCGRYNIF